MKRNRLILLQACIWTLLFISELALAYSRELFGPGKSVTLHAALYYFIIQAAYITIPVTCFYCSYLFVAPQLFVKRQYMLAFIYSLLTLGAIVALRYVIEYYFFIPFLGFDNYRGHPWPVADYIENIFFYYFPKYFVYGLMYFFIESWYNNKILKQELEKEKAAAELTFLRSQVNPHFLFNTINDIYSLTYRQSELAPVALLQLSEILRYMLREGSEDMMLLQSEIKYLENVIELQRISAKGNVHINVYIEGYIGSQKIGSLLFIAFIENAFKHGVLTDPENPVQINLLATADSIQFRVQNKKNSDQKDKTGGIGLNNVRRRLALLYPGNHNLTIDDSADSYSVNLELQLT